MNRTRPIGCACALVALAALAALATCRTMASGLAPVDLGTSAPFAILAGSEITSTGGGDIYGDVGLSPATGAKIVGVVQEQVQGVIYAVDEAGPVGSVQDPDLLLAAKNDLTAAYNDAAARTPVPEDPPFRNPNGGDLGGLNLVPGLYKFDAEALISSDVTLTGGPDDVWIFQIGTALTVSSEVHVVLEGGAAARNIFWQVGSSATLGTFCDFKGTIMADQSITMDTSSTVEGRALARIAAVTFNGAHINLSQPSRAELSAVWGEWVQDRGEVLWRTDSEVGTAGYFLYRVDERTGAETRLNALLLPSTLDCGGARYRLADPAAVPDAPGRYRLEEVELSGAVRNLGIHEVSFGAVRLDPRTAVAPDAAAKFSLGAPTPLALPGPSDHLKLTVARAGIYAVSFEAIAQGMGLDLATVRDQVLQCQLSLRREGRLVAYLPDETGARLLFYAAAGTDWYRREAVYWIRSEPGLHMARRAPGTVNAPAAQGAVRTRFEEDRLIWNRHPERLEDIYYWDRVISGSDTLEAREFEMDLHGTGGGTVRLRVKLVGLSNTDHRAEFAFNGEAVGALDFSGQTVTWIDLDVPPGEVLPGLNRLRMRGVLRTDQTHSFIALDWVEAAYQRVLEPGGEGLLFTAGDASGSVSTAAYDEPLVLSVDDPERPQWIADDAGRLPDEGWSVAPGERFAVRERAAIPVLTPVPGVGDAWFMASDNRVDYLVVTSRALEAAARELADYRAAMGLRTGVAFYEEICDLFTHGQRTPEAIRALIRHAHATWAQPPWLVVLAGHGNHDYRDVGNLEPNHLPPLLRFTQHGMFASDGLFVEPTGGGAPLAAIGRLPARTPAELRTMLEKNQAYEAQHAGVWHERLTFAADWPDEAGDFEKSSEELIDAVGPLRSFDRIYLGQTSSETARQALHDAFHDGTGIVNYTGHGGLRSFSALLNTSDLPELNNPRTPVIVGLTCLAGWFDLPGTESLAEGLVRRPGSGAVAVWTSGGLSYNHASVQLGEAFYRDVFHQGGAVLGPAIRRALSAMPPDHPTLTTFGLYNLLGDPALKLGGIPGGHPGVRSFAQWRWNRFAPATLADPSISGPEAGDEDVSNLEHYAFGTEPGQKVGRERRGLYAPEVLKNEGLTVHWRRRTEAADLEYRLRVSRDLQAWETNPTDLLTEVLGTAADAPEMQEMRSRIHRPGADRLFLQLQVLGP